MTATTCDRLTNPSRSNIADHVPPACCSAASSGVIYSAVGAWLTCLGHIISVFSRSIGSK
ncbi:MAG: hypothetical protein BWY52_03193 [Chloroflexi bacterium ADurb.Bin325]|nr:MAG: hypothetical protein BWY52_03193 [Chloroflexi bacterium ADurb.Bin325]